MISSMICLTFTLTSGSWMLASSLLMGTTSALSSPNSARIAFTHSFTHICGTPPGVAAIVLSLSRYFKSNNTLSTQDHPFFKRWCSSLAIDIRIKNIASHKIAETHATQGLTDNFRPPSKSYFLGEKYMFRGGVKNGLRPYRLKAWRPVGFWQPPTQNSGLLPPL